MPQLNIDVRMHNIVYQCVKCQNWYVATKRDSKVRAVSKIAEVRIIPGQPPQAGLQVLPMCETCFRELGLTDHETPVYVAHAIPSSPIKQ